MASALQRKPYAWKKYPVELSKYLSALGKASEEDRNFAASARSWMIVVCEISR